MNIGNKIGIGFVLAFAGFVGNCTYSDVRETNMADATDDNCYRRLEIISRKDKPLAAKLAEDGKLTVYECTNDVEPRIAKLVDDYQNRELRNRVLAVKEEVR